MSRTSSDEQLKFLLSCVKYSNNGKIDFVEVAKECGVVSKGAAAKRYERLMKANGINPNGGPTTPTSSPGVSTSIKKRDPKNPKSASKKRKIDDGNIEYFHDGHEGKETKENDHKPETKQEPDWLLKQEMEWHPMFIPPHTWEQLPPYMKPAYSTKEYGQFQSMPPSYVKPEFDQPRSFPIQGRYILQPDGNGSNSLVLENGFDSIFRDFCTDGVFDPIPPDDHDIQAYEASLQQPDDPVGVGQLPFEPPSEYSHYQALSQVEPTLTDSSQGTQLETVKDDKVNEVDQGGYSSHQTGLTSNGITSAEALPSPQDPENSGTPAAAVSIVITE